MVAQNAPPSALFGLSFALYAIPVELNDSSSSYSKIHLIAACIGLICWLFGLVRIASKKRVRIFIKIRANITAVLLLIALSTDLFKIWPMSITARLVYGVVFGWIILSSYDLRIKKNKTLWK